MGHLSLPTPRSGAGVGEVEGPGETLTPCPFPQYDDGSGMKREATADDLIKVVEELTRIH